MKIRFDLPTFTLEYEPGGQCHVEDYTDDVEAFNRCVNLRRTIRTKITITKKWGNVHEILVFTRKHIP